MSNPLADEVFRRLPPDVLNLLQRTSAPPRLIAHLVLVHDVASKLVEQLAHAFPELSLDKDAILFGAATHDIGKTIQISELVEPGKAHERRGVELLREMGVPEERARFAYTHGNWDSAQNLTAEDLLVALADNCWKGKRVDELETKTIEVLSVASGKPKWDCYAKLDEILGTLAAEADSRLEWQREFGIQLSDSLS